MASKEGGNRPGQAPTNITGLRPASHVVAQRMGEEIVLIHLQTNRIYELNATGARLWELLNAGYDRAAIQQQLLLEYVAEPAMVEDEINSLLDSLLQEGLLSKQVIQAG